MRHAFEAALDAFEPPEEPVWETTTPHHFERVVSLLPVESRNGTGSHSLWEFAAAWTPEADPPPPTPPPPPPPPGPSGRPEDIAAELNFLGLRTAGDIARARRRFMWENHPDRRGDIDRDLANRRVAIANGLLDQLAISVGAKRAPNGRRRPSHS